MTSKANYDPEIPLAAAENVTASGIPLVTAEPTASTSQTTLAVVAPSDMVGGYEFFADAGDGKSYKVRVPAAGAKQGQEFDAIIVESAGNQPSKGGSHNVPTGQWRDGLCDCCEVECCKPSCCLGFWCRPILLGQVLTRNSLDWFANPLPSVNFASFKTWFVIAIVFAVTSCVSSTVQGITYPPLGEVLEYNQYVLENPGTSLSPPEAPGWAQVTVSILSIITTVLTLLMCITTCRARIHLRERYNIPTESCGGCEDCCCAWWCAPCTVCQMARHTADYSTHPSTCCTATGLRPDAPEVV